MFRESINRLAKENIKTEELRNKAIEYLVKKNHIDTKTASSIVNDTFKLLDKPVKTKSQLTDIFNKANK